MAKAKAKTKAKQAPKAKAVPKAKVAAKPASKAKVVSKTKVAAKPAKAKATKPAKGRSKAMVVRGHDHDHDHDHDHGHDHDHDHGAPELDSEVEAVAELVSLVACPRAAVNELALACENALDSMDMAAGFARFTSAAWNGRPGEFSGLDAIANDLVDALERQANTIGAILDRLAPLAGDAENGDEDDHADLDPAEVLERLRPLLAKSRDAAIGA